ncbi:MAG TPA: hypothetical protein VNW99_08575 [Cytophagaceae bacterium]|nr:hypothetical protein [Cytophagaceae bacterium]
MKEIFEQIKIELPKFLSTFVHILTSPRNGLLKTVGAYDEINRDVFLTKAFVYYFICNLITSFVFLSPIYGAEEFTTVLKFVYFVFIILIFVLLSALALKVSWNVVGVKTSFYKNLITLSYHTGTFFTIYILLNIINLAILRFDSIQKYDVMVQYTYFKGTVNPFDNVFSDYTLLTYQVIGLVSLVFVVIWFYRGWACYRIMNKSTKWQSFFAAVIFSAIMALVFVIDIALDRMLNLRNY